MLALSSIDSIESFLAFFRRMGHRIAMDDDVVAVVAIVLLDESLDDSTDAVSCFSLSIIEADDVFVAGVPLPFVVLDIVSLWSKFGADLETWFTVGEGADKR